MRFRTIALIVLIVLMAGFAALNVDEFSRTSVLSLGFTTVQVPLGLVMLVLLAVVLLVFLDLEFEGDLPNDFLHVNLKGR